MISDEDFSDSVKCVLLGGICIAAMNDGQFREALASTSLDNIGSMASAVKSIGIGGVLGVAAGHAANIVEGLALEEEPMEISHD